MPRIHKIYRHKIIIPPDRTHLARFSWTRSLRITKDRDRCSYTHCVQNANSCETV